MAEEYDNKNSGALYPAENMEIIRQGKIDVEGNDVYMLIVKMKDKNGNDHYKFYQDKAKIFETEKKSENSSDMDCSMSVDGTDYKVWLRKKVSKNGLDYTSVSLAPKTENKNNIPF
mgnify:FL=1